MLRAVFFSSGDIKSPNLYPRRCVVGVKRAEAGFVLCAHLHACRGYRGIFTLLLETHAIRTFFPSEMNIDSRILDSLLIAISEASKWGWTSKSQHGQVFLPEIPTSGKKEVES